MLWDWPKGHWEPCNKLKCLSPAKCLMRFEPFDLNLLLHSPLHLKALTLFPQCLNLNSPLLFFCHCHCVTTLFIFNKNKFFTCSLQLKGQEQISRKLCFKKLLYCHEVCQFSIVGPPHFQSYLLQSEWLTSYLSVFFLSHGKNLVLLNLINI